MSTMPPLRRVAWRPSHRIIATRHPPVGVFDGIADPSDLDALFALEGMTNPRLRQELGEISLVPPAAIPEDWRTARERRLQRYLETNGLIDGAAPDGRSSASVTVIDRPPADYDPDGFYLNEGPNNSRAARRARIEQMLSDEQDDDSGFTLF